MKRFASDAERRAYNYAAQQRCLARKRAKANESGCKDCSSHDVMYWRQGLCKDCHYKLHFAILRARRATVLYPVCDCGKRHYALGLCRGCYLRQWRGFKKENA